MMNTYIKVILIASLYNLPPGNAECDINYDSEDVCYTVNLTCRKPFTLPVDTLRILTFSRPQNDPRCIAIPIETYNNYRHYSYFHEVNLKYVGNDLSFINEYNSEYKISKIITTLDLCDNGYQEMPREIFKLYHLKRLIISRNSLKTVSLYDFDHQKSLTELDVSNNLIDIIERPMMEEYVNENLNKLNLSHNYLVMIPDLAFKPYTFITHLDLSHNFIDVINTLTFEGLQQLQYLNVSNNRLSELNKSLSKVWKLFELDLSRNQLQVIVQSDFEKLTELLKLNLSNNEIKTIEKLAFDQLSKLEDIDLSYNVLEFLDKEHFRNTPNLKKVDLTNNFIHQLSKDVFENKHLSSFSIENNILNGSLLAGIFEGLDLVKTIDLCNQYISSVEDYAFLGLKDVEIILLSKNKINKFTLNSFRTLKGLRTLDLSDNSITTIDFSTDDLINLQTLNFKSNELSYIKMGQFTNLLQLLELDLSFNKIINIETQAFQNLSNLSTLIISNNPLSAVLQENTFDGLFSLKSLQLSFTQLTILKNNSFAGLSLLRNLNVSHCKLSEVQFDAFNYIDNIENIDLSHNQLHNFSINAEHLNNLRVLYLDENYLKQLESSTFNNIPFLHKLSLKNNNLSKFSVDSISKLTNLVTFILSGIDGGTTCFNKTLNMTITKLVITQSNISNVSLLSLKNLQRIETLVLNNDNINSLSTADFSGIKNLIKLDLSHNKIPYIQPGTFKDNNMLSILNISHNFLSNIGYGVFHGLTNIDTIDLSYNSLSSLKRENFHDIKNIRILIADHNHVSYINISEFEGAHLTLSIGDNPVPCEMLVNLLNKPQFEITATYKDSTKENVGGITCNINNHLATNTSTNTHKGEGDKILRDIKNILLNISEKYDHDQIKEPKTEENVDTNRTVLLINEIRNATLQYNNITNTFLYSFKKLFEQISKSNKWETQKMNINNTTTDINRVDKTAKNESSFLEYLKDTLVQHQIELEQQVKLLSARFEQQPTSKPDIIKESNEGHIVFMEICLALILIILVCFTLYKIYYSKVYILNNRSISTRAITESEANSEL